MSTLDPLSTPAPSGKWKVIDADTPAPDSSPLFQPQPILKEPSKHAGVSYARLSDTLRLYAGWLLAWYVLIFSFGSYQLTRRLPVQSDLLEQFFSSAVLVTFAFGAFIFLLCTDLHKFQGRTRGYGAFLLVLGIGIVWLFAMNT